MSVTGLQAAKHFCELNDWQLSNLALNKLIYVAHMVYLGRHNEALVKENFEAWSFGPVLPPVYHKAKAFGRGPVRNVFSAVRPIESDAPRQIIEIISEKFAHLPPGQLVAITHWEKGAWAKNYDARRRHVVIPNEDIAEEYRERNAH